MDLACPHPLPASPSCKVRPLSTGAELRKDLQRLKPLTSKEAMGPEPGGFEGIRLGKPGFAPNVDPGLGMGRLRASITTRLRHRLASRRKLVALKLPVKEPGTKAAARLIEQSANKKEQCGGGACTHVTKKFKLQKTLSFPQPLNIKSRYPKAPKLESPRCLGPFVGQEYEVNQASQHHTKECMCARVTSSVAGGNGRGVRHQVRFLLRQSFKSQCISDFLVSEQKSGHALPLLESFPLDDYTR